MVSEVVRNIGRFVLLVLLQGLILNEVSLFNGLAVPYFYILFLLMLPLETPRWAELLIGLVCGLSIDMFNNTMGMHASACVLLSYLRPLFLKSIAPRDGYEFGMKASVGDLGLAWYTKYALVLVLVHHFWLLFIEVYSFSGFWHTALRALLGSLFTFLLVILSQYLTFSGKTAGRA